MEGARVTSVISNRCIRTRLLVFKFSNVRVGVVEYYLQIFVGMLVSRIGGGPGGWASVPLWRILLLAWVVVFTGLSSLWGVSVLLVPCCHFLGSCCNTVSNIMLLFNVCLSLIVYVILILLVYRRKVHCFYNK